MLGEQSCRPDLLSLDTRWRSMVKSTPQPITRAESVHDNLQIGSPKAGLALGMSQPVVLPKIGTNRHNKVSLLLYQTTKQNFILTYSLNYSMEQSPFSETNRFSDSQEIPRILWNPKIHYHVYKCPPPVPIQKQDFIQYR